MTKTLFFSAIFCLLLNLGCGSKSEPAAESKQEPTKSAEAPKADTSKGDILASLQGKWQSLDDTKNVIEIKNDDFITIYEGKEVSKEKIGTSAEEVKTCIASATGELDASKVFMTKGQFDATCFLLLKADAQNLEYTLIGGTGKSLNFKKI